MKRATAFPRLVCTATALLAAACASTKHVQLVLHATPNTNGARSCYVLVRAVDPKGFGAEPYAQVAVLVTKPDASIQSTVVMLPGEVRSVTVPRPKAGQLAVQALLRSPERDSWRLLLPETPPDRVHVRIEERRICPSNTDGLPDCVQRRP